MADSPASHFAAMRGRIEETSAAEFGGALVICPPSGEAISFLLIDPAQDTEHFWAIAESRVKMAVQEHLRAAQGNVPHPRW